MSLVKRGAFIVLEGIDRTGKTTQVKLLQDHFSASGVPTVSMRFPGTPRVAPNLGCNSALQAHISRFSNWPVEFRSRFHSDRTTPIGSILDGYLAKGVKVEAHAVHLVFAANRWEARCARDDSCSISR